VVKLYDQISGNKWKSWALMLAIFVLVIITGFFFGYMTGLGDLGLLLALFLAVAYSFFGYYYSDRIVLGISGAKEADPNKYPNLCNTVEGLAIAAGIPAPKAYVIEDSAPNAFATGRDPAHGAIAVTTGLLNMMNRKELEGVIGHEMSHIKNYDIRFATIAVVMVGMISIMGNIAMRILFYGGYRGGGERRKGEAVLLIIGIILIILAPIFAQLVRLAISRKREFLADASGALLTRYPDGLADALEKLGKSTEGVKNASDVTAPLYIVNPLSGKISGLFSTHPPIEERIKALREM
jgi:heat shock protein HtpX